MPFERHGQLFFFLFVQIHCPSNRLGLTILWTFGSLTKQISKSVIRPSHDKIALEIHFTHTMLSHYLHMAKYCFLLAILILLGLTVMILLLFWSYQCLFVTHICQGQEDSSVFPVFDFFKGSATADGMSWWTWSVISHSFASGLWISCHFILRH